MSGSVYLLVKGHRWQTVGECKNIKEAKPDTFRNALSATIYRLYGLTDEEIKQVEDGALSVT